MNPFDRPLAGSYKNVLVEALRNVGNNTLADEFQNGSMKLAIVSSITGNPYLFPQLTDVLVDALDKLEQNDIIGYYTHGLLYNDFVAASTNGAFVYNPQDTKAVEYVNEQINISNNEIINPYFN